MTTHTPGPWVGPVNTGATRFEIQGGGRRVAVVDRIEDARLIAAAPDMLAKLADLAGECAECDGTGFVHRVDGEATGCPECADIFAVIAKATQP